MGSYDDDADRPISYKNLGSILVEISDDEPFS
jgi:hypothetical protein